MKKERRKGMTITISERKRKGGKSPNPGKQFEKDFYDSVLVKE